jgi:hypothetical protein
MIEHIGIVKSNVRLAKATFSVIPAQAGKQKPKTSKVTNRTPCFVGWIPPPRFHRASLPRRKQGQE